MNQQNIAIIGAGIGGIGAAVRLAAAGHRVAVFEANSYPGGKLSNLQVGDYRFDAGPSLFTMPQYVEELFALAGENPKDFGFDYHRLDTVCKYFWEDGQSISAYADLHKYGQEVEEKLGFSAQSLKDYLAWARFRYETTAPIFLEKSLHRLSTYLRWKTFKGVLAMPWLGLHRSLDQENKKRLKQHPKMVQLFNRYATYNGSSPYKTPGIMSLIPHLEQGFGAFMPKGGMKEISHSLVRLAEHLGVKFHYGQKVEEILVQNKAVKGIRIGQKELAFDQVVCNMDIFFAYDRLLPKQPRPKRILEQPKSSSALIFYWGMDQSFPELDVHNIFFSDNYPEEFRQLFEEKSLYEDPTVYIHISSKVEQSDAPLGHENWFVMINAPQLDGQDWEDLIAQSKKRILQKLERILGRPIQPHIVQEELLSPALIQAKTQSHLGSLYGTSSNNSMAAFFRHPNFSRQLSGLYFVGGSVHPGGGIPLALLSAKLATEDLIKNLK